MLATDTLSMVILRSVPKRDSAAQMLAAVRALPPLTTEQAELMDAALADQRHRTQTNHD